MRESIHAVESVARVLSNKSRSSLGPALDKLAKEAGLHPSFKQGLLKLYGYTSDESGIRHSLLDKPSRVGAAEAQFMIGACAAFISYMLAKGRESDSAES